MNKLFFRVLLGGLILVVSPTLTLAHNPLSARYHWQAGEQGSLLTINLSQDGINLALLQTHEQEELERLSQQVFEELIVDYLKANFSLKVNEQQMTLQKGGIKLGSHQTDLKFVLPAITQPLVNLDIAIPAFQENGNHQTIFSYAVGGRTDRVILSEYNDYKASISLQDSTSGNRYLGAVTLGVVGLMIAFLLKARWKLSIPTA